MTAQPYRYLDYYRLEDAAVYFGREREIRILHTDIVVNRLVVLFARTGTGKTSLINAGVRPRLEPDYATFWVRVEDDPLAAVRTALGGVTDAAKLPEQLRQATAALGKPVVVFFDQFEEFFEHIPDLSMRQEFVTQVAETYQDTGTEARIVFAMREEYFHEMDDFRDQVPSIFHRSSNLRLRLLTEPAAREAIVGPLQALGAPVDAELVDRLVADLRGPAGIEPAQLQIVCDTLWRDGRMTLADYLQLGGGGTDPADRIYQHRVEQDLDRTLSSRQLRLFEMLMPQLCTANRTKKPAELAAVETLLGTEPGELAELVDVLAGIGLVRPVQRYGAPHVEWTSDFLAGRTDDLIDRTVRIYLVRRVVEGLDSSGEPLARTTLAGLSEHAERVAGRLGPEQLRYVLSSALYHDEHVTLWTAVAEQQGLDVLAFLAGVIEDDEAPLGTVTGALRHLTRLGSLAALALLQRALAQESLAATAVEVIAASPEVPVLVLLGPVLDTPLGRHAVTMLGRQQSETAILWLRRAVGLLGPVGLAAASALQRMSTTRPSSAQRRATAALQSAVTRHGIELLRQAMIEGAEPVLWWQQARSRGLDCWPLLERSVRQPDTAPAQARGALALLAELARTEPRRALFLLEKALTGPFAADTVAVLDRLDAADAVPLLERAVEHDAVTLQAARGLYEVGRRGADAAAAVLRGVLQGKAEPLFRRAVQSDVDTRFWFDRAGDYGVDQYAVLESMMDDPAVAPTVVRLMGDLCRDGAAPPAATRLLRRAAYGDDALSRAAIEQIRDLRTATAVDLLTGLLGNPATVQRARRALEDMAVDWRTPAEVVERAWAALGQPQVRGEQRIRRARPVMPTRDAVDDSDWERLLRQIAAGSCVPILGTGASAGGELPTTAELAQRWAEDFDYPLPDPTDLAAVIQFLTTMAGAQFPRELLAEVFDRRSPGTAVHRVLADLPLPVYLTLGFDDLLTDALRAAGRRPQPDWPGRAGARESEPSPEAPLVHHLFGHPSAPESLVLTPSEVADRQARLISRGDFGWVLPTDVGYALDVSSALVLGVPPDDQILRLLLDRPSTSRQHMIVLPPDTPAAAQRYFGAYLATLNVTVYWGELAQFATELGMRWSYRR